MESSDLVGMVQVCQLLEDLGWAAENFADTGGIIIDSPVGHSTLQGPFRGLPPLKLPYKEP